MEKIFFDQKIIAQLKKFIFFRVNSPEDAEEILQETLIAAVESLPTYSGRAAFLTWLCSIARHETADFYRKKKIKTFLFSRLSWLESLASQALGPEQQVLEKEFSQKVKQTLANLNEGYREILRLKYYQGLTVVQIAKKLNETVKAVESRLFRARKTFAKVFTADAG